MMSKASATLRDIMKDKGNRNPDILGKLKEKGDGFTVPADYFDGFESRVFERIEAAGIKRQMPEALVKSKAKRVSIYQYALAAAAVFAMVLAAVWFFRSNDEYEQPMASVTLSEEDIEAYLLENVRDFEVEQLAMLPTTEEPQVRQAPSDSKPVVPEKTVAPDPYEISPEDIEHILNDMTEEELQDIL